MTVTLELSPDREAALKAAAQAQGISTQQWLEHLVEERLQSTQPNNQPTGQARRHISQVMRELVSEVPREVFEGLPNDCASEHDHYLYGTPKRYS